MVVDGAVLRRWTTTLLVVTGALAAISLLLQLTLAETRWDDLATYLDVSSEHGLAAWWNAGLLALVGAAALVSAGLTGSRGRRWGWAVVGAVALLMSLDEATRLHERTAHLVTSNPLPTFTWLMVGIPLAAGLVGVLTLATRTLSPQMRRWLGLALAVYLLGALGMEALSGYFWRQGAVGTFEVVSTLEEALEMVACVYAVHVIVRSWLPLRVQVRAPAATTRPPAPPAPGPISTTVSAVDSATGSCSASTTV